MSTTETQNLYERLGGRDAVNAAVDIFYEKVLSDDRIKHFFDDVDMVKQKGKQKAFLTFAFGGPNRYEGKHMREGHAHLLERGLDDSHVDAVVENLGAALADLDVPQDMIDEVQAIANSVRDDVLSR